MSPNLSGGKINQGWGKLMSTKMVSLPYSQAILCSVVVAQPFVQGITKPSASNIIVEIVVLQRALQLYSGEVDILAWNIEQILEMDGDSKKHGLM